MVPMGGQQPNYDTMILLQPCRGQLSHKTTSDATLDGLSVGWTHNATQDGPDFIKMTDKTKAYMQLCQFSVTKRL